MGRQTKFSAKLAQQLPCCGLSTQNLIPDSAGLSNMYYVAIRLQILKLYFGDLGRGVVSTKLTNEAGAESYSMLDLGCERNEMRDRFSCLLKPILSFFKSKGSL